MSVYIRIDKTTITNHVRKRMVNIMRNRPLTAMMTEKGRVTYNASGKNLDWRVKYRRNGLQQYGDGQLVQFDRLNRDQVAVLPWRGYILSESVTKMEELSNRGQEAIVKVIADITDSMLDDVQDQFEDEFFKDGNAAGNESRIHGFDSATGTGDTAQYVAPSDTYAGLDTTLGAYGGSIIDGTWPAGQFDAQYDFWSPLIVNYTDSASWTATTKTWPNTAAEAIRAGITHCSKNASLDGMMDYIGMPLELFRQFKDVVGDKERIQVRRDGEASGLVNLGFRDVINYDGVDCHGNYSVPSGTAYGLNFDSMELLSMQPDLFVPGSDYDITHLAKQYTLDYFGNLKFNPRDLCKWVALG